MTQPSQRDSMESAPATRAHTGFLSGFRLGSIAGIEIRVDFSLLIIFALISFNLGAFVFPRWHPDWSPALDWAVALASAVLFFASVLAHELSHALVGRAQGIPVRRITLFIFGGMAHMEGSPPSPKSEFWMAIVGPVTSIVIGLVASLAGGALAQASLGGSALENPEQALAGVSPLPTLLLWLGPINVLLGIFNIIPGFPLDGGRVLRSLLWGITGDLTKATHWASGVGRGVAWLLMGIGAVNLFGGALLQGMWLLLIGWFLNNAARMGYQQLLVRQALEDVPVTRLMRTGLSRVAPETSVEVLVREIFMASDQETVPVEDGGRLVGLVSLSDVRAVPRARWPELKASDIMVLPGTMSTLPPDAAADQALQRLGETNQEQIPVVDHGKVLGVVAGRDLVKWLSFRGVETHP